MNSTTKYIILEFNTRMSEWGNELVHELAENSETASKKADVSCIRVLNNNQNWKKKQ